MCGESRTRGSEGGGAGNRIQPRDTPPPEMLDFADTNQAKHRKLGHVRPGARLELSPSQLSPCGWPVLGQSRCA